MNVLLFTSPTPVDKHLGVCSLLPNRQWQGDKVLSSFHTCRSSEKFLGVGNWALGRVHCGRVGVPKLPCMGLAPTHTNTPVCAFPQSVVSKFGIFPGKTASQLSSSLHFSGYWRWISLTTVSDISFSGPVTFPFFNWFVPFFQVIILLFLLFHSHL